MILSLFRRQVDMILSLFSRQIDILYHNPCFVASATDPL